MPTLNQLVRKGRKTKHKRKKSKALNGNPQLKGVVSRIMVINPKKPNSANRHCCRVKLSNGQEVTCIVPGKGMAIQVHSNVLVIGGNVPDLPGVRYKVVRGALDCGGVDPSGKEKHRRAKARSKYGVGRIKDAK